MIKLLLFPLLTTISLSALGAIDYSSCEKSSFDLKGRVNSEGKIIPRVDEKITEQKSLENGLTEVTFENTDPRWGNFPQKVIFKKDRNGRVTGTKTLREDYSKMSKENRDRIKRNEAYKLAHGHFPGQCAGMGFEYPELGWGGVWRKAIALVSPSISMDKINTLTQTP